MEFYEESESDSNDSIEDIAKRVASNFKLDDIPSSNLRFDIITKLNDKAWDLKGLNPNFFYKSRTLNGSGLSLFNTDFDLDEIQSKNEYRMFLGDFAIEMWLRSNQMMFLFDNGMDIDVGMKSRVDFVVRNSSRKLTDIYEVKTYLNMPSDSYMVSELDKFRKKYKLETLQSQPSSEEEQGETTQDLEEKDKIKIKSEKIKRSDIKRIRKGTVVFHLVVIIINQDFIASFSRRRKNRLPDWMSAICGKMRFNLLKVYKMSKEYMPESKIWDDNMPSFDDLVEKFPWFEEAEKVLTEWEVDMDNPLSMDYLTDQIVKFFPAMETFANSNYISTKNMGSLIRAPMGEQATISSKRFWSRDHNQIQVNGESKGIRANYLMFLPVHESVQPKVNTETWLRYSDKLDDDFAEKSLVKSMALTSLINPAILEKIKEMRVLSGIIRDLKELPLDIKDKILEFTGFPARSVNDAKRLIKSEFIRSRDELADSVPSGITVTKRGTFSVFLDLTFKNKIGVTTDEPFKKTSSIVEKANRVIIDCKHASEFDWFSVISCMPTVDPFELDFSGAYPESDISDESDRMAKILKDFGKITNTKQYGGLMTLLKCYRAIILSMPRSSTKQARMNEFFLSEHPDLDMRFICSTPPNDMTTGAIVATAILREKLPEWYIEGSYTDIGDGNMIYVSKPFRLNRKSMEGYERSITAYIGFEAFMNECGTSIINDGLFYSLFLNYNRQIAAFEDIIYLYYKNLIGKGNFGKSKISEKFDPIYYNDVRVAAMSYRLKSNWKNFKTIRDVLETGKGSFPDLIFDIQHTGLQSFSAINYMRQTILPDDGVDKVKKKFETFSSELKYETWFRSSPFHPDKYNPNKMTPHEDLKYFFSNILKNNSKWEDVVYCKSAIVTMISEIVDSVVKQDPSVLNKTHRTEYAMDLIRPSKVMDSKTIFKNNEFISEDDERPRFRGQQIKPEYKGLKSLDLGDSVIERIRLLKEVVLNNKEIKNNPFYNPDLVYKMSDSDIDSGRLALFSSMLCHRSVLKIEHKDQFTYDKRGFFVQHVDARNMLSHADRMVRKLLEKVKGDFILVPGSEKYKVVEDSIKRLGHIKMIISQDETKYGDTYVLQSLIVMIITLYKKDYITRNSCIYMIQCMRILMRRYILLPRESHKLWEATRTHDSKTKAKFGKSGQRFEEVVKEYSVLLEEIWKDAELNQPDLYAESYNNPGFYKSVGFTLGVLNMIGSLMTAAHSKLVTIIMGKFGMTDEFEFFTHSDDSIMITKLPCPNGKLFTKNIFDKGMCRYINNPNTYFNESANGVFVLSRPDVHVKKYLTKQELSKFVIVLSLITPRFVGQHPSLAKWMMSLMGEVLQSTIINGKMNAPLIRYMCALGSDTDGVSPGQDLMSSCGRIFDIGNNGGGSVLCAKAIWILNHHIYGLKYSIPVDRLSLFRNINFGGLFWALPSELMASGFTGNLIRLLSWTKQNEYMKRHLAVCIFDDTIWSQKTSVRDKEEITRINEQRSRLDPTKDDRPDLFKSVNEESINEVMRRITAGNQLIVNAFVGELDGGMDAQLGTYDGGAMLVFKDIQIGYMVDVKSRGNFMLNYNRWESAINSKVSSLKYVEKKTKDLMLDKTILPGVRVRLLADVLAIESMAGSREAVIRVISRLAHSISMTSMRSAFNVHISWKIISQLGYLKRRINNPFSQRVCNLLSLDPRSLMDVDRIWEIVDLLSKSQDSDLLLPQNKKMIETMVEINSSDVRSIHNAEIKVISEFDQVLELKGEYVKLEDARGFSGFEFSYIKQILSVLIEIGLSSGTKKIFETVAFRLSPLKVMISSEKDHIRLVSSLITRMGIPDTVQGWTYILTQREMFVRLLTNRSIRLIHKAFSNTSNVRLSMLSEGYSLRKGRKISYTMASPKEVELSTEMKVNSMIKYRAWSLLLALRSFYDHLDIVSVSVGGGKPTKVGVTSSEIWDDMLDRGFSKSRASIWLLACTFEANNLGTSLNIAVNEDHDTKLIMFEYRSATTVLRFIKETRLIRYLESNITDRIELELTIRIIQNFLILKRTSSILYEEFELGVEKGDYSSINNDMVPRQGSGNIPIYIVKRPIGVRESDIEFHNGYIKVIDKRTNYYSLLLPWSAMSKYSDQILTFEVHHKGSIQVWGNNINIVKGPMEKYIDHSIISSVPNLLRYITNPTPTTYDLKIMDVRQIEITDYQVIVLDSGRGLDLGITAKYFNKMILNELDNSEVTLANKLFDETFSKPIKSFVRSFTKTSVWSTSPSINFIVTLYLFEFITAQPISDFIALVLTKLSKNSYRRINRLKNSTFEEKVSLAFSEQLKEFYATGLDNDQKEILLGEICTELEQEIINVLGTTYQNRDNIIYDTTMSIRLGVPSHLVTQMRVEGGNISMAIADGTLQSIGFDQASCEFVTKELSNNIQPENLNFRISLVGWTSVFANLAAFMALNNQNMLLTFSKKIEFISAYF